MFTRSKDFYDIVAHGLASVGYTGSAAFHEYVNETFANKYNAEKTFAQAGFPLNPNIPINPTFEQLEATIRPYSMAGYVDIDSDGPTKSTEGMTLKMGSMPTFKHEITLSRKTIREKMLLAENIGKTNDDINSTVMRLLFNGVDNLLGGNYNTMLYQRHQIVSNQGKLVINANNNPMGYAVEIDFGVPSANKTTSTWYTKSGDAVTQATAVGATSGTSIDPIKVMRDIKYKAEHKDFAPAGHWEVSKKTFDDLLSMPYFREMYVTWARPDITAAANKRAFGALIDDETLKSFIEARIGAKIVIVDATAVVEKFNTSSKKMEYTNLDSFNEGVLVYVPDGAIGDAQFGRPIAMETPGARIAMYDGGRTMLRSVFEDKTMTQVIGSEVTGLIVPNKVRWMYYLTVKG